MPLAYSAFETATGDIQSIESVASKIGTTKLRKRIKLFSNRQVN